MKIFLPLLLSFFLFITQTEKAFAQNCPTPTVTMSPDKGYCGPQTITFTNANGNHQVSYTGTNLTYSWSIDGVVSATNTAYPSFSFQEGRTYRVSVTVSNTCGSATASQAITVEARPNPPIVENGGMCTGTQGTLWVTSPNPNYIYKWYNVATGGSPLVWGTTYTTATPGTYYIEATTQAGCTSSTRTAASLTATSPTGSGGGISTSTQQVCSGETPGLISGNAPNSSFMTYQWFQSTTGVDADFFPIASARNRDYTPSPLSQTTWFKRVAYNNYCGEESNVLKITVVPRPATPVVNDVIVCSGTQASFTVANADLNTVYKWYANTTTTTSIGTGPTFTSPQTLSANTSFYVEASTPANSSCSSTTARVEAKAVVTPPITNNTISADQSLCSGGTPAALTGVVPQGGGGTYTYQWQRSENGADFFDIPGANAQDFAPGSLSTTTWYRRKVTSTSSCPPTISNTVRIGVAPLPVSINITDPMACAGSGTTIVINNADPATYTYRWYDVATGGSVLGTGSSFPTGPLTSNKTYYVEATTSAGCISNRRAVTVTVTTPPAQPVANGVTVCAGNSATLAVNPTDATLFYRWYNSEGTILSTGVTYPTGPLSENTTFYVEAVTNASPGCTSPKRAVLVTVLQPVSNNTITANQMLCRGETPAQLQGNIPDGGGGGYTYQWQYSEDGTYFTNINGATGIDYAPQVLSTTTWFRRMAGTSTATCPAVASNVVKVEINQLPVVAVIPGKTICTGTSATLQIPFPDGSLRYNWYTAATGGMAIALNAPTLTTEALTSDKTYYVEAVSGFGCISATRRAVTVTVSPLPAVPVADDVTICAGNKATLTVMAPTAGLEYQWYDAAQGGSLLASGTTFTTANALASTTTYYVQAVNSAGCASASRKAVVVSVIDLPVIPEVTGATICSGGSTTLYISNPTSALVYRWYNSSGTLLQTGTSLPTGNLATSATYYVDAVTNNASGCASPGRRTVVVTVIPPIANNTITASQTICNGDTPALLNGSAATGGSGILTYQWEKSENGTTFTNISSATAENYSPGALTTTTWFRRRVKGADSCSESYSNTVQVTVNALPATPVADAQTVCTGTAATLSINAPVTGITYKWYNAATGGNVLGTGITYPTGILETNTTFYVEATNGNGCISPRQAVTVSVRALPEMPMAAGTTICYGQNTTLAVTSPAAGLSYKWYNTAGQLLSSQTTLPLTNVQATTTYYLEATYTSNPTCASPRREVTVIVTPLPALPVVNDITICAGATGRLQVQNADPALTYKWYTVATGGTSVKNEPVFDTPALTSDRTYYVEATTAGGCASGRKAVNVRVTALPETPLAADVAICAGETATLIVTSPDDALTYNWYTSATALNPVATGQTYPTGALQATTTYYLEAMTASGCASASRQAVQVTVTPLPAEPMAEDKITCAGGYVILSVQNPDASLRYVWYNADDRQVGTGIFYNTGSLSESTTYYLEAITVNTTACTSATRKAVAVTVTPLITNNTITASQSICSGSTPARLDGSVPAGGGTGYLYQWEQSADGSNFTSITGETGQHYSPGALNTTTWFRRKVTATGPCGPSYSPAVQITTIAPPATPLAANTTICAGTTATLQIQNVTQGYTYRWYAAGTGGNILDINSTFVTPEISATTTYYVEAVNGTGCVSPRRAVTVTVTPVPELPQVPDKFICQGQTATLTVSAAAQNLVYTWYDNAGTQVGSGTSFTTPQPLSASTTFYVEAATTTTPSCVSARKAVAVTVTTTPNLPVAEDLTICAGSTARLSVRIIDPAITYKWYTVATGGTSIAESPAFTTAALTSNRTYYVEAVNGAGCTSGRTAVSVTVTPLPATPVAASQTICSGSTAILAVTGADANLVYNWYDAAVDGNLLASGDIYTTAALQNSTTYYLEAATRNGCTSTSRSAVTVTVTPLPATPEVNNQTICAGASITLWVTNQTNGIVYKWYNNAGAYLATGTSYTTPVLDASTTFAVEAVTNTPAACASAQRKAVFVTVVAPITNNTIGTDQMICMGAVPFPLTGSTPAGGNGTYTYQWERSTDGVNYGSISGAVSKDYAPGAISTTTWFRRRVQGSNSCPENSSVAVQIRVNPLPITPVADASTICTGTGTTLQVNAPVTGITYKWYGEASGGNVLGTGTAFETDILRTTTTYYVDATNASGCVSARRPVTVTVRELPEMPLAENKTICAGQNTTLSVSTPDPSFSYTWYNAAGQVLSSVSSLNVTNLQATTTYYLEAAYSNNPTCASPRREVTVTVTPLPGQPVLADITVCAGAKGLLQVQNPSTQVTYNWYSQATGGSALFTGEAFETPTLTSDRTYYAEAVTASGCASGRVPVTVHVAPLPEAPFAPNMELCAGRPALLAVSDADETLTYRWYASSTAPDPLATGNTYNTGILQTSTTYYVEALSGNGCVSPTRSAVTVTVTPLPATPVAEDATICAGGFAVLSVQNPASTLLYKWYKSDGTHVATGQYYNTGTLNNNTTYYLEAVTNNSTECASASRRTVTVTVTPGITNNTIASDQTICHGATPAELSGSIPVGGGTSYAYQWEQSADGTNFTGITGATTQHYTPGALTATTWFRRRVSATGPCTPAYSAPVRITIVAAPATPLANNQTICAGTTATLSIRDVTPGYTYRWYATATGGNALKIDDSFNTPELSATTTYYVEAVNGTGCVSPRRAVTVVVTDKPAVPAVADAFICAGQKATLAVSSSSQNLVYSWYDQTGTLVGTGTSYTTQDPLPASTTFYVEAATISSPACISDRRAVAVSVTAIPAMPEAADATICAGSTARLSVRIIDPAITYKWYTVATGGTSIAESPAFTTAALTSNRTYYVEAVNGAGCTSGRTAVSVTITPLPATPVAASQTICSGSTAVLAVTGADANLVYNWYDAAVDGNLLASGDTYTTAALQSSTTYYLEAATRNGCASTSRSAVTVTVTPLPATPEVNNQTICAGASITLWVTNPVAGLAYKWYDNAGGFLSAGNSYTTGNLDVSATYYVEAVTTTATACASAVRRMVQVTVVPPITNNFIGTDQTICTGAVPAPLTGSTPAGGNGTYTYQWERSTDGMNFSAISGATSQHFTPTSTFTADVWYRRKVTAIGSPCAEQTSNTIHVTVTPLPATPVANGATSCAGSSVTLQVSNPDNAFTYHWYATATGGNPLRSLPAFETGELSTTTTFYVEAMNATGCISARRAVTVTVRPLPEAPVVENKAICTGQTTTLAVTSPVSGVNYKWYTLDGTQVATGTSFATPALDQTTIYQVEASYITPPQCAASTRTTVTVEVAPQPQLPQAAGVSTCSGSTATLAVSVVDPNVTYKWYTAPTGGTAVASTPGFTTPVLTSGRTYYVEAVSAAGCASGRTAVVVEVVPLPAVPLAANMSICAGQKATLQVTDPDNALSYVWYDAATEGSPLATGDTYTTAVLTSGATYYVAAVTATGCVSTSRRAVTVDVTPLPATPEADNVTICAGSTTTLWVRNQEPNVIYNWYSGGALAGTGVSFTTGTLNNSTTYYLEAVTNTGTACSSPVRSSVVVTVTPAVANNFINASQSICSGSTPATLTGSLPNGGGGNYSYQWERSEDGINFTSIANATNQHYTPTALNITTWFRRKVRAVGPCAESISSAVQITITPIPATPMAANATICQGAATTLSIQDANTAYTYRWYTSPVGGSAILAGTSFTTNPLESTTTFYVEAVNNSGCISPRRTVTVSVLPLPAAPLAEAQNICAGEQATLAVTNQEAGLTYSWYDGNNTLLATGTTYTTGVLNSNTVFYVEAATAATPSCLSPRTAVAVNVATRPATPVVSNVNVCTGSAAELVVSGILPGITYSWYTVATGGTPIHTGSRYTTPALTTGRTYYVEAATASGCTSSTRRAVAVGVIPAPATPVAPDKTICAGQPVTLAVANPDATLLYRWYDQNGTQLATGNTYTTPALSTGTTYFVEAATQTSPSCSSPRETVNVTITPLPATPVVEDATICAGSTAVLWISNTVPSVTYKWYNEQDELLATGPGYTTPVLQASATYYVTAETTNGCASATRKTVTVTVAQAIANNVIQAAQTICYNSTPATLTGSQPVGGTGGITFQWERSEDGINFTSIANAAGREYTPEALTATTWFRRKAMAGITCPAHTSAAVEITVVPLPAMPRAENVTVCAGSNATLRISTGTSAPSGEQTYRWYTVATGGSSIATGASFTATSMAATTTYFVEAVNASGCYSARRAVTVFVTPLPEAPEAADKAICAGEQTTLSVTSPDSKLLYNWYDGNGILQQSGTSFTTPALSRTTVYYVEATTASAQACTSSRRAVTVSVTQQPARPLADNVTVCSGSSASITVKDFNAALTYKWYTAAAGGTALATGPTFNTSPLSSSRTYYVEASTASGCISERKAVLVEVTPLPALPVVTNQTICAGQTATLTVADEQANLSYRWFDAPVGGNLLTTGSTYTTRNLTSSSTYYVEAVTANGCVSMSRKPAVVTVLPLPAAPAVENATICAGEAVTLWVKNPDPALEYRWYSDATATDQIGTGLSYTSGAIPANRSYFVAAVNSGNCASATLKQVDVTVVAKPGVPLVNAATVCTGSSATLAITAPDPTVVYKWFDVNGALLYTGTSYTTESLTANTTYAVTAYAASRQACASASQTVTVTVVAAITDNEVNEEQTICYGSAPTKLTGTLPAGGGTNMLYQWERSADGVSFTSIAGGNAQDYTPGALTATTWFRRKVKTAGPCPESISNAVKVTVVPLPAAPLADNVTTCAGSNASLSVKNAQSGMTYNWYTASVGGTFLGSGITFTSDALTANTTFYVEAANGSGCVSSTRKAVVVSVVSAISNNTISAVPAICYGETPARITGTVPGGTNGAYTYQWQQSDNGVRFTDVAGATAQSYSPTGAYTRTTWFRRKVTATGPCPESYSNLVKVVVVPLPAAPVAASQEICPGNSVTLTAAANGSETLEWYDAPVGGNLLQVGTSYATPQLVTTTSYFVQAVNSTGCVSPERREVKAIVVAPEAIVSGDVSIFYGKAVKISAEGGVSYKWSPEIGLSDPTIASPMASPKVTTTYTVTVTTAGGCIATNQVTVTVSPKVEPANVITPNGDGYNDVFQIRHLEGYENCTVQIFSRWGEMVFETRGYTTPWDGTKNGRPLPAGAYYYVIRLNATEPPISGSITLMK
ncbi:gliding motility-associated C-terminal domain-containing protein [Pontibacter liquoris]|uniref:Ig-like domain-containing protein n=1 Tax=Pontibacter liquoris TaxID=2905677 RepID=UPI001FA7CBFE|nr:gliding motility-associated C-terminal domain-containing protein [Pontibacter liquoris]